jgi:D-glycero-D-manno-heptose 1,7-bisphosphate phosphatase
MKPSRKALLLDRDGVINVNHGYVHHPENCDFIPGIFALCAAAQKQGYRIIIVTNQSGIARRYYSRAQFHAFSRWIEHAFFTRGIAIQQTLHCPHHPKESGAFGFQCCCRKPRAGMIFRAQRRFHLNLSQSIMVGDSWSDVRCGQHAKIGKVVHFQDPLLVKAQSTPFTPNLYKVRSRDYYRAKSLRSITRLL